MPELEDKLKQARIKSWERYGKGIIFYLPGMFSYNGLSGKYPAISITGSKCRLQCDHCQSKTLVPMIAAQNPESLVNKAIGLAEKGNHGILISGGCDEDGRLPWNNFTSSIKEIKKRTGLFVSIHCGLVDYHTALALKEAGVDQALIDVIGDDETYREIYHVPFGISRIISSMEALNHADIPIVPHIVCGLHYGKIKGEAEAINIISRFKVRKVVIVVLMTIPGTPLWGLDTPEAEEIADLIADARFQMPDALLSLGCARKRGDTRLEILAIDAGINRMALPSGEAIKHAEALGLQIRFQKTCCSVSRDFSQTEW